MERLIATLSATSALVIACGGGFYKVDDALRKTPSGDRTTVPTVGYISATIDLENSKLLTSSLYTQERDGELSHLYVYAEFDANVGGATKIPLYLIDLKKGTINDTRGAELISAIPFNENVRGDSFFRIETRALKETAGDKALAVYSLTNSLAKKVAGMALGPQVAPIFSVIDDGAKKLESYATSEQQYKAHVAIPKTHSAVEYSDIYLVLPTDQDGNALSSAEALAKAFMSGEDVSVCRVNDRPKACVGNLAYDKLAYIIVNFRLHEFVTDPLLLNEVGPNCHGVRADTIRRAEVRVEEDNLLSSAQRQWERAINARARVLEEIRSANKTGNGTAAIDALDEWLAFQVVERPAAASADAAATQVVEKSLFSKRYASRFQQLETCFDTERRRIRGADIVDALANFLEGDIDVGAASEADLEAMLLKASASMPSTQDKSLEFIQQARLYHRAAARHVLINDALYQRFYKDDVTRLRAAMVIDSTGNSIAQTLEKRIAAPTHCEKCRNEAASAVHDYKSKKPQAIAAVETERTLVLTDASTVASRLEVAELKLNPSSPAASNVANQKQEIERLTNQITTGSESTAATKAAIKDLSSAVREGRKVLNAL